VSHVAAGGVGWKWAVPASIGVLVAVAAGGHYGPRHTMLVVGPAGAVLLLLVGHLAGLSRADMGIGPGSWRRGAVFAAAGVAGVAVVYAGAALMPATRSAFLDQRYLMDVGPAVLTAFVVIPLGTVLFEEVAFRGVLWGLVCSTRGPGTATVVSSMLFGFWHVLPSLRLNRVNPAVAGLLGTGRAGQLAAVTGAVVFTALAGALLCELRRRSGSLLAPAGLHWAANGLGVLVATVAPR
jgi:membrane protease YdiL (CAAX protease family)